MRPTADELATTYEVLSRVLDEVLSDGYTVDWHVVMACRNVVHRLQLETRYAKPGQQSPWWTAHTGEEEGVL